MQRTGQASGDVLERSPTELPPTAAPQMNERIVNIPVIGVIYSAGMMAKIFLFEGDPFTGKSSKSGPVMNVFKAVVGLPVMTLALLVAGLRARGSNG